MPETVGEAFVAIRPDTAKFAAETQTAVTTGVKTAANAAAGLLAGYGIVKFLHGVNDEARESQKVGAQTAAVLKSTAGAANIQQGAIESLANELSKKAGIDDEVIQSGENMLLTFRNIRNEAGRGNDIFNQATRATLDLAAGMAAASGGEIDLKGASIQLGKALNDPISGITALQRVGVQFTAQQKDKIKSLVEEGKTLEAQKIILKEVNAEFAGSAAAQATAADKAGASFKNFEESLGTVVLPILDKAAQGLGGLADGFSNLPGPAQEAITYLALLGGVLLATAKAVEILGKAKSVLTPLAVSIKNVVTGGGEEGFLGAGLVTSSAAAWAAGAALIAGSAIGLSRTISGENYKVNVSMKDLATTSDAQLKKIFATFQKIDPELVKANFNAVLKADPAQAQRLVAIFDSLGIKTGAFKKALGDVTTAESQSNSAHQKHQAAVDGVGNSYGTTTKKIDDLIKKQDELTQKQDAAANADLRVQSAQLDLQDALVAQYAAQTAATDAGGQNVAANQALERQTIATKQAILDDAQAVRDQVSAHYGGVAGSAAYKQELERLAGAMAPDSPLRQYIEGLINDIHTVPTDHHTEFSTNAAEVASEVQLLIDKITAVGISVPKVFGHPILQAGTTDLSFLDPSSPNYNPSLTGTRASGGPVGPGTWLVGEQGPELLTLGANGNGYVTAGASRAGAGIQVNITTSTPITDRTRFAVEMHQRLALIAEMAALG